MVHEDVALQNGLHFAVEQVVDGGITFSVKGRDEVDQSADGQATQKELQVRVADALHEFLHAEIHPVEVDGEKCSKGTECDEIGQVPDFESLCDDIGKEVVRSTEQMAHHCPTDRGKKQGNQRGQGEVQTEDLDGKYHSRNGRVENARKRPCCGTTDQQNARRVIQMHQPGQIGADGRAGGNCGSFQSNTATKPNGDRAGDDGSIHAERSDDPVLL